MRKAFSTVFSYRMKAVIASKKALISITNVNFDKESIKAKQPDNKEQQKAENPENNKIIDSVK